MIPDILFTYWEGNNLSYFNYLTILSLHTYNPAKNIIIYTSKTNSQTLVSWRSNEHTVPIEYRLTLNDIQQISQDHITIIPIDFDTSYLLDNNLSCVFKADIIRIYKLHEHGGMWFDFDILFIKPIPAHIFNSEDIDFMYYVYHGVIPTGLLISTPNNRVTKIMYHNARTLVAKLAKNSRKTRYQLFGPELWSNSILNAIKSKPYEQELSVNGILSTAKLLDTAEIYPYLYDELEQLYNTTTSPETAKITDTTWGIHWYNGAAETKHFINNYCKTQEPVQSIMHKYITQILTDAGKLRPVLRLIQLHPATRIPGDMPVTPALSTD